MSTWDVILGGGITLVGTVVTQLTVFGVARGQRRETRKLNLAEYERTSLERLQAAAMKYRSSLVAYHDEIEVDPSVSRETDRLLQQTRMDFQALLHRVHPDVVQQLETWQGAALAWSQNDGSAARENRAWDASMRSCGERLRAALSEK